MNAADRPRVRVGIVTFDNVATIGPCLDSLDAAAPELELDVRVLDNGSTDGTADTVASGHPAVTLIRSSENLGFGAGQNRLLLESDAALLLVLNPDTTMRPGSISRLVETLAATEDAAAVGPRIEYPDGSPQPSFDRFPGWLVDLRRQRLVQATARRDATVVRRLDALLDRGPLFVDWISGACMLVDGDRFRRAGGFDERFHLYLEDVDLCRRFVTDGGGIWVEPRAVCMHIEGGSPLGDDERRKAYRRSRAAYERKHGSALVASLYSAWRGV